MSNLLITGATGHLGTIIVEQLVKKINPAGISVLVRDENKAHALKALGVNVKKASYQDKEALSKAMENVDKVLLISSSDFNDRLGQHKNVVDAAQKSGVKHLFYTGAEMKDINTSPLQPLLEDHFKTEAYILGKGLPYTFLRNGLYFEIIPMFAGEKAIETGITFPSDDGKVAFAARKDLGEAIANILTSEGHENKTYALSGNRAYSFKEVAAELTSLSGKTVLFNDVDEAGYIALLKQFGLPQEIIGFSALFAAGIKHNDFNQTHATLETFLGRPQTDLRSFLKETYHL